MDDKVEVTSNTIEFCVEKFLNSVLNNEISKVLTKDQIISIKNAGINFDYANYGLEKKGNNYVLRKDSFSLTALTLSSCNDPDNYIPLDLFVGYCSHFC